MFKFSVKLEKWSFHVAHLPRTGKKCAEMKKAREGRAKLLFCFIKYAEFVALSVPSRRRSYRLSINRASDLKLRTRLPLK